jgi:hypothetical protein
MDAGAWEESETSAAILRIRKTELAEHSSANLESFDRYSFSQREKVRMRASQ